MSKVQWWFNRRWSLKLADPFPASLTSLVPNTVLHGSANLAVTVNGKYFQPGAKLVFGSSNYTPAFVSPTQLTVTILAADLATAGTKNVTVTNVDGRVSNALPFTIT